MLKLLVDEATGDPKSAVLVRAWAMVCGYVGGGKDYVAGHKDGFIHACEFKKYFRLLFLYNELFSVFEDVAEGDKKVSLAEFLEQMPKYLPESTPEQLTKTFAAMDQNGGGAVLFDEFARFIIGSMP